jgi:hypothetical protein
VPAPQWKEPRGAYQAEREARKRKRRTFEDEQKDLVRTRDGKRCRWPHCPHRRLRTEVAHLRAKGMGGDHGLRSTADQMLVLCVAHHQWDP